MKILKQKYIVFALIILATLSAQITIAQNDSDLEGWSSVGIDLQATKKLSFSVSEHLRSRNNITTVKNYFTQFKVNYEVLKNFEIGGGLRYITKNDDVGKKQGLESFFRYQFDASFKHKIKTITVVLRLRYQNKHQLGFSESEGDIPKEHMRFRIGLGYKIKPIKLDLKLFGELFNETESLNSDGGFNRYRYTFRVSKKIKKIGTFALFYGIQDDTFEGIKTKKSILGFKYSYAIDFTK